MDRTTALKKLVSDFPGGQAACAATLGITFAGLRNRLYEIKGQRINIDEAVALSAASGSDVWIQAVCAELGGVFVPLPQGDADRGDILDKFNVLYAQVGDMSADFKKFVSNDEIDKGEREHMETDGIAIASAVQELLSLVFSVYCKKEH